MDIVELLGKYIVTDGLILIPVLVILGTMLKSTPKISDWIIPYILLIVGVVLALFLLGFDVYGFIQGVLISGAAVFAHQLYKQSAKKQE
ncbi:phage holin family protein [Solibacillus sp. FSL W8-0474]|uniref:phage holin family protein n=1 Tax=Solibacillus sp. FSL W8-0474 TaxID=2975336 RepID=UPI0030FB2F6E